MYEAIKTAIVVVYKAKGDNSEKTFIILPT